MPEHLHSSTLFHSSLLTVSDWRCRPTGAAFGAEEESSGYVLVFPRTGLFVERRRGRDDIVGDSTRVHFFNRNETYRVSHPVLGGDDCTSIRFGDQALREFLFEDNRSVGEASELFQVPSVNSSPAMSVVLHQLRQALLRQQKPDNLAVEENAVSLLIEATAITNRQQGRTPGPARRETCKAHRDLVYASRVALVKFFRERLTLEALARAVFSSPFHLARVFRRETGISLHVYLTRLRLRQALQEIADGASDLTRLALELGFSSHSHFTNAFKREFGESPSRIRCRLRQAGKWQMLASRATAIPTS